MATIMSISEKPSLTGLSVLLQYFDRTLPLFQLIGVEFPEVEHNVELFDALLLGESAATMDIDQIRAAILAQPEALEILSLKTMHVGPEEILIACKISVAPTHTAQSITDTINQAEVRIRSSVPEATYIFIEPDIKYT